ncbi:substrate-binding domain-containing protein [Paenibacillus abyssi]|uniref:Sugar ABC transporter substrate-binding protein n=1 Tax=Paenibacillus abyssi TaxID=1340531 RepID=A0A917CQN5_9BACL|nr:substrate-binding domain-containing protein [Paenibacillus abyssi]GGF93228.1 sugar ABC transporter substrate-binding protein [Paenibacillus abyssi]
MSRKALFMLVSVVLVFTLVLSACGNNSNNEEASTGAAQNEPAEVPAASEEPAAEEPAASKEPSQSEAAEGELRSTGPKGEKATAATELHLTDEEIAKVKEGKYTAAIVMHYGGNDWASLQIQGLRDRFAELGIEVVAETDAQFKAEKQASDIETVLARNPDIIVSIPVDPVVTAPAFKKAAEQGVKLVFMDNVPNGLEAGKDYVSIVTGDNYGNGIESAEMMAEAMGGKGKVAMLYYDANFFVSNQRDQGFEETMREKYPDIEIVAKEGFADVNKATDVADAILLKNPDLVGLYSSWDVPLEGIAAKTKGSNMVMTAPGMSSSAAMIMAQGGSIKGISAQFPYEHGIAEATVAAYSLLGKTAPDFIVVPTAKVTKDNLLEYYERVYRKAPPQEMVDFINK